MENNRTNWSSCFRSSFFSPFPPQSSSLDSLVLPLYSSSLPPEGCDNRYRGVLVAGNGNGNGKGKGKRARGWKKEKGRWVTRKSWKRVTRVEGVEPHILLISVSIVVSGRTALPRWGWRGAIHHLVLHFHPPEIPSHPPPPTTLNPPLLLLSISSRRFLLSPFFFF